MTFTFDLYTPKSIGVFPEGCMIHALNIIDQSNLKLSSGNKFVDGQTDRRTGGVTIEHLFQSWALIKLFMINEYKNNS